MHQPRKLQPPNTSTCRQRSAPRLLQRRGRRAPTAADTHPLTPAAANRVTTQVTMATRLRGCGAVARVVAVHADDYAAYIVQVRAAAATGVCAHASHTSATPACRSSWKIACCLLILKQGAHVCFCEAPSVATDSCIFLLQAALTPCDLHSLTTRSWQSAAACRRSSTRRAHSARPRPPRRCAARCARSPRATRRGSATEVGARPAAAPCDLY